jgi:hypothetical protein
VGSASSQCEKEFTRTSKRVKKPSILPRHSPHAIVPSNNRPPSPPASPFSSLNPSSGPRVKCNSKRLRRSLSNAPFGDDASFECWELRFICSQVVAVSSKGVESMPYRFIGWNEVRITAVNSKQLPNVRYSHRRSHCLRQSFTSIGAAREGDGPLVEAWLNERLGRAFLSPYKAIRKLRLHPAAAALGRDSKSRPVSGRERAGFTGRERIAALLHYAL